MTLSTAVVFLVGGSMLLYCLRRQYSFVRSKIWYCVGLVSFVGSYGGTHWDSLGRRAQFDK